MPLGVRIGQSEEIVWEILGMRANLDKNGSQTRDAL